ncbi:hypothetical protein [Trueperella sp. LYQ143]|uniref:hypothetical protein n=1 Tax=Trueperella sp. LYQ143 TaxID=3391059 RepID=UPI0039831173
MNTVFGRYMYGGRLVDTEQTVTSSPPSSLRIFVFLHISAHAPEYRHFMVLT